MRTGLGIAPRIRPANPRVRPEITAHSRLISLFAGRAPSAAWSPGCSALRQLVLQAPAPVITQALGFHHTTTQRQRANAGGTWSHYAGGHTK